MQYIIEPGVFYRLYDDKTVVCNTGKGKGSAEQLRETIIKHCTMLPCPFRATAQRQGVARYAPTLIIFNLKKIQ